MVESSGPKPEWCLDKKKGKNSLQIFFFQKFSCKLREVKEVGNFRINVYLCFCRKEFIVLVFSFSGKIVFI